MEIRALEDLQAAGIEESDIGELITRANEIITPELCLTEDGRIDLLEAGRRLEAVQDPKLKSFLYIGIFTAFFMTGMAIDEAAQRQEDQ
jgi:hypothetical protein